MSFQSQEPNEEKAHSYKSSDPDHGDNTSGTIRDIEGDSAGHATSTFNQVLKQDLEDDMATRQSIQQLRDQLQQLQAKFDQLMDQNAQPCISEDSNIQSESDMPGESEVLAELDTSASQQQVPDFFGDPSRVNFDNTIIRASVKKFAKVGNNTSA